MRSVGVVGSEVVCTEVPGGGDDGRDREDDGGTDASQCDYAPGGPEGLAAPDDRGCIERGSGVSQRGVGQNGPSLASPSGTSTADGICPFGRPALTNLSHRFPLPRGFFVG